MTFINLAQAWEDSFSKLSREISFGSLGEVIFSGGDILDFVYRTFSKKNACLTLRLVSITLASQHPTGLSAYVKTNESK